MVDRRLPGRSRRTTRTAGPLTVLLLAALLLAACGTPASTSPGGANDPGDQGVGELPEGVPAYMVKGDADAPITMVEWSDYQCPYCAVYSDEAGQQIDEVYVKTGKVRMMFRDFPLNFHPNAIPAAVAARCVGRQGGSEAYWRMHDLLFHIQDEWSALEDPRERFAALAEELELDRATFDACTADQAVSDEVKASFEVALQNNIGVTPTFVANGAVIEGALPFEQFEAKIELLLAGGTLPTNTPEPTVEYVEVDAPSVPAEAGDAPFLGVADAPVTIIEYSDYQCPYSAAFVTGAYPDLVTEFVDTGQVRLVFKDFPLTEIHPLALAAAQAAHCARDQGGDAAYFKMHDALFGRQADWSGLEDPTAVFGQLAEDAGLDGAALLACVAAETYREKVEAGKEEAVGLGLQGTPTFALNGQVGAGALPIETFREAIATLVRGEKLKSYVPKSSLPPEEQAAAATPEAPGQPSPQPQGPPPAPTAG